MIKKLLLFGLVAGSLSAQVDEQPDSKTVFSLEEAKVYAMEHGYSVQNKQLEFEKARQTINQTRAMGLPQVTTALDFNYNAQIPQQPVPAEFFGGEPGTFQTVAFGTKYQNVAGVTVNQLLWDGSYLVALKASNVYKEGARLDQEVVELQVRKDVAQAYYAVLITEETIKVIKENLGSLEKSLKENRALYENGFREEQDVDQIELLVSNLTNNLDRAQRTYDYSRMMLNFNLGRPVSAPITLTSTLEELIVEEEVIAENAFSIEDHISYQYSAIQAQGAQLNVKNENQKYFPTLSGFVRHNQSNYQNDFSRTWSTDVYWVPSTVLGFSLKWDLLEGLRRPADVQLAKLDLQRAELARDSKANSLKLQFEQAKTAYEYAFSNFNIQQRNVELSKKIRDKTYIKYQEGISSSLELTQTENQYLEAQQNYLNAMQSLLNAKEDLILAIGKY